MHQVKENGKLNAEQKRFALWYKCTAKFGKVAKCAAGAKSLRTTALCAGATRRKQARLLFGCLIDSLGALFKTEKRFSCYIAQL